MYNLPYVRTVKPNIENNGSNHKSKVKLVFEHLCDGLVTLENMSTGLTCTLSGNQAVSVKYSTQRLLKDMYILSTRGFSVSSTETSILTEYIRFLLHRTKGFCIPTSMTGSMTAYNTVSL